MGSGAAVESVTFSFQGANCSHPSCTCDGCDSSWCTDGGDVETGNEGSKFTDDAAGLAAFRIGDWFGQGTGDGENTWGVIPLFVDLAKPSRDNLHLDPAHLDGDGYVGVADLALLLAAWGFC